MVWHWVDRTQEITHQDVQHILIIVGSIDVISPEANAFRPISSIISYPKPDFLLSNNKNSDSLIRIFV
jgi:hypothetical protein